ncbi:MAG: hypothetical protein U1E16_00010, partial [Hyphomicrobiales bacterium]
MSARAALRPSSGFHAGWRGGACKLAGIGQECLHFCNLAVEAVDQFLVERAHAMGVAGHVEEAAQVSDLFDG